jgi:GDP/UDP-N,N'-diacetylbacillosamine 2-epimerase (hydrolysing)
MNKHKICFITGSRSEYDRIVWLLRELKDDSAIDLRLVVTGSHLSKKFGDTVDFIKKDGFKINSKIQYLQRNDTQVSVAKSIARLTIDLVAVFDRMKPDMVLIYGDRYELLSVANVCLAMQIPLAHIGGGHITQGAIDNQVRYMLTKAAHLHMVANAEFAKRIRRMGEDSWRIAVTGSPALDCIKRVSYMSSSELSKSLGINISQRTAIVTFHPATLELENINYQINELLRALTKAQKLFGLNYVITYPNADAGNNQIIKAWKSFEQNNRNHVVCLTSLGEQKYLSLLKIVGLMIGNSSSGIIESPSFNLPTVNIGDRQKGRILSANIFQSGYSTQDILRAISRALHYRGKYLKNPYGGMNATKKIIVFLKKNLSQRTKKELLTKGFVD